MGKIIVGSRVVEEYADIHECPFCKSTKLQISHTEAGGGYNYYYVYCKNCSARGPVTDCMGSHLSQEAVRLWNRWRDNE